MIMNASGTSTHLGLAILLVGSSATAQEVVTIDSAMTYQTMRGWEVTSFVADPCDPAFPALRDALIPLAVDDIGINRVRLEIRSGVENSHDYYADWVAAGCPGPPDPDYTTWRQNRYATVDDNGNPDTINWGGFHFTELDWNVENIILPLKQQMEANGENLFINLNYVAFTSQIVGGSYHHDDVAEYAEFVLVTYLHLQNEYGLVPDTWELVLNHRAQTCNSCNCLQLRRLSISMGTLISCDFSGQEARRKESSHGRDSSEAALGGQGAADQKGAKVSQVEVEESLPGHREPTEWSLGKANRPSPGPRSGHGVPGGPTVSGRGGIGIVGSA
jgi:hypothetical protein